MTTRHLVDPEVAPLIDLMPAVDFDAATLAAFRDAINAQLAAAGEPPLPPTERLVPGRDGAPDVPVLVYDPPSDNRARAAVLHMHGGGMITGSAAMSKASWSPLALALDVVVVSVDYRLAPDTRFPGPQEDCYAALAWLDANAAALGVDPARIAVAGESAGGGLAAAVALMARDRGEIPLIAQILTYPMLDHRTGGPRDVWQNPNTGEFVWTRSRNVFGWEALRGDYAVDDARAGWFSPARAADLSGLPPTWIGTGSLDLFYDENLDYARRLTGAGVPVELVSYAGAIHAFQLAAESQLAQRASRDFVEAVARLLG